MKRLALILSLLFFAAGCSPSKATEPALNFPNLSTGSTSRCRPADLEASSNYTNADGALILGVSLINISLIPCSLSNPPLVSLLSADKTQLDLQNLEISPNQTPPAAATIELSKGESAIITLVWENYCAETNGGNLVLQVELAKDQTMNVGMDISAWPKCKSQADPSTLTVAPYSYPP